MATIKVEEFEFTPEQARKVYEGLRGIFEPPVQIYEVVKTEGAEKWIKLEGQTYPPCDQFTDAGGEKAYLDIDDNGQPFAAPYPPCGWNPNGFATWPSSHISNTTISGHSG